VIDESLGDEVRVTVIATGFGGTRARRRRPETVGVGASSGRPLERERSSDAELEIPSFLRED